MCANDRWGRRRPPPLRVGDQGYARALTQTAAAEHTDTRTDGGCTRRCSSCRRAAASTAVARCAALKQPAGQGAGAHHGTGTSLLRRRPCWFGVQNSGRAGQGWSGVRERPWIFRRSEMHACFAWARAASGASCSRRSCAPGSRTSKWCGARCSFARRCGGLLTWGAASPAHAVSAAQPAPCAAD